MGSGGRGAIAEEHPESVFTINGIVEGTMLVDGARGRDPVAPIVTSDRAALKEKKALLLAMVEPNDRHALVDAYN